MKTGFLRSLFKVSDKKLNQIISKLLTFSKSFTFILIATFCFNFWNIFEHALRYFITDNNYKLLIIFQQVNVYLNETIQIDVLIKLANKSN